jgi:hypothetical protein
MLPAIGGNLPPQRRSSPEKEDAMWIVYLVVGLVGIVFGLLSLLSLDAEA